MQCNDSKTVHLALLGLYERTEQHRLADELLDKMTKKFKTSCKVVISYIFVLLSGYMRVCKGSKALLMYKQYIDTEWTCRFG